MRAILVAPLLPEEEVAGADQAGRGERVQAPGNEVEPSVPRLPVVVPQDELQALQLAVLAQVIATAAAEAAPRSGPAVEADVATLVGQAVGEGLVGADPVAALIRATRTKPKSAAPLAPAVAARRIAATVAVGALVPRALADAKAIPQRALARTQDLQVP